MKKSKLVSLVLVSGLLASCGSDNDKEWSYEQEVYMRGDETAPYSQTHYNDGPNLLLMYMAFRPYGFYNNGTYVHSGMYNNHIPHTSNIGKNTTKTKAISRVSNNSSSKSSSSRRGGFGGRSRSSSS